MVRESDLSAGSPRPVPDPGGQGLPGGGEGRLPLRQSVALAGEIASTYLRVRWRLRRRDLAAVVSSIRTSVDQPLVIPRDEEFLTEGRRLGRRVARALDRVPWDSRCLVRSLVLVSLLARRGVEGRLLLGVRTEPEFEAHAWVEVGGEPLLDPGPWRHGRLAEY